MENATTVAIVTDKSVLKYNEREREREKRIKEEGIKTQNESIISHKVKTVCIF